MLEELDEKNIFKSTNYMLTSLYEARSISEANEDYI